MKYQLIIVLLAMMPFTLMGQIKINSPYKKNDDKTYIPDADSPTTTPQTIPGSGTGTDEAEIGQVVQDLFTAMNQSNAMKINSLFSPEGRLLSTEPDGSIKAISIAEFSDMIGKSVKGSLEERINSMEIRIDDHLATAWVEYDFFYNKALNHCGVDAFQLHKGNGGWKIIQITDTRREACVAGGTSGTIDNLLNKWHMAASKADAQSYFDAIATDGIYLGTDPGESWNKESFIRFAKPFFDKGSAWSFKATDRKVYFSEDGQISWFNELLDTWMGPCRGSGVLKKQSDNSWKIMQYNLAMLVPNDLVQDYLKLKDSKK
jgi:hypothetical protein